MSEKEPEEEIEPEREGEGGEKKLESTDIAVAPATPVIVCQQDSELMEIEGSEVKEVEERGGFLGFGSSEEFHTHLKYKCPTCGRYYYHDLEAKRQGCFIATAAYGTPLAKEIDVLRKVRDSYLLQKEWGQKFVDAYYTISPPIAEVIKKSENLRKIVRILLRPIIKIFKNKVKG